MNSNNNARKEFEECWNFHQIPIYQYKSSNLYIAMSESGDQVKYTFDQPFKDLPLAVCQQWNTEIRRWQIRDKDGTWIDTKEDGTKYPEEIESI